MTGCQLREIYSKAPWFPLTDLFHGQFSPDSFCSRYTVRFSALLRNSRGAGQTIRVGTSPAFLTRPHWGSVRGRSSVWPPLQCSVTCGSAAPVAPHLALF